MITTSTFLLGSEYTPKFKFTDLITYGSKNPRDIEVPLLLNGKTYYEILDVTPNVSSDEVQEAYINKRQERGINPRELHIAYVVLKQAQSRADYAKALREYKK